MFHSADVLVYVHPVIYFFFAKRRFCILRITVAQEIPGGIQERVHGIQFSSGRLAADRTCGVHKGLACCQRRFTLACELYISRQQDRQIFFLLRNPSTVVAVNHRDRSSPVSLSGDEPVSQLVVDGLLADFLFFQVVDDLFDGFLVVHAVEHFGVDHRSFCRKGSFQVVHVNFRIIGVYYRDDLQVEFLRKVKVSLVMSRYRHDRSGTIVHENVIRDEDRNLFTCQRIDRIATGKLSCLLVGRGGTFDVAHMLYLINISVDRFFVFAARYQLLQIRMLRCHYHIRNSIQGVRSRGEDVKPLVKTIYFKGHFCADALADPVFLHQLDLVRPAWQFFQIVKKPFSVICDLKIPL